MLILNNATYSTIYPTLTEKSTGATTSFIFVFTNDQSGNVILATSSNLSDNTQRYDKFILSLGTINQGYYSYKAYENIIGGTGSTVVETGKALCQITNTGIGTTFSSTYNTTQNKIVYGG